MPRTFRAPIEKIRLPKPVAAGMNPYVLMCLAQLMRSSNEDPPPVKLEPDPQSTDGGWVLEDGRHRLFGAVMAGRPDVLATDEDEGDEQVLPGSR